MIATGTKLDMLKAWCQQKHLFSTTDVKLYGIENFYTSSDVRVRQLASEGFLRAIPDEEAILKGLVKSGNRFIRWYEAV